MRIVKYIFSFDPDYFNFLSEKLVELSDNIEKHLKPVFFKLSIQGRMNWLTNFFFLQFSATYFLVGVKVKRRENVNFAPDFLLMHQVLVRR